MINYRKIFLGFIGIMCILFISGDNCKTSKNIDYINEIIKISKSEVMENGLKVEYETFNNGEDECKKIYSNYFVDKISEVEASRDNRQYCIKFKCGDILGHIESVEEDNKNRINIEITEKNSSDDLKKIKEDFKSEISENSEVHYYQYVKGELHNSDINILNLKIIEKLSRYGVRNIKSLNISNGYYTVADTDTYDGKIDNGKLIDLNYAICNYSSGNYIIIGTPEITTSF